MKELKVGDFCLVNGKGLDVFMVIGEGEEDNFEVMTIDGSSCMEMKYKCKYISANRVEIESRWIANSNPYYKDE